MQNRWPTELRLGADSPATPSHGGGNGLQRVRGSRGRRGRKTDPVCASVLGDVTVTSPSPRADLPARGGRVGLRLGRVAAQRLLAGGPGGGPGDPTVDAGRGLPAVADCLCPESESAGCGEQLSVAPSRRGRSAGNRPGETVPMGPCRVTSRRDRPATIPGQEGGNMAERGVSWFGRRPRTGGNCSGNWAGTLPRGEGRGHRGWPCAGRGGDTSGWNGGAGYDRLSPSILREFLTYSVIGFADERSRARTGRVLHRHIQEVSGGNSGWHPIVGDVVAPLVRGTRRPVPGLHGEDAARLRRSLVAVPGDLAAAVPGRWPGPRPPTRGLRGVAGTSLPDGHDENRPNAAHGAVHDPTSTWSWWSRRRPATSSPVWKRRFYQKKYQY